MTWFTCNCRSLPRSSGAYALVANVHVSATNALADGNGVGQNQGHSNEPDHKMMQERGNMGLVLENRLLTNTRKNKGRKPLPPPPPPSSHHDRTVQGNDSGTRMTHSTLATSQTPNTSTDHLYDSLDTPIDSGSPFYHTLDPKSSSNKASDSPNEGHIYHVLDGLPGRPMAAAVSKCPSNTTNPPRPLPQISGIVNRPRMNTCVTNPRVTQGNNMASGFHRSLSTSSRVPVSEQLSSVVAIYAEVPEDKSPSVLLPPRSPVIPTRKGEPGKTEESHIYHVLEVDSPKECQMRDSKNLLKQQQQTKIRKLKENGDNVLQMGGKQTESNGMVCNGQMESCKFKPVNLKKKPVAETEEENEYAKPNTCHKESEGTPACPHFDDSSHCSQPSATNTLTTLCKTVQNPAHDAPSHATPTTGEYKQPLFDDPQYDSLQTRISVQPERPAQTPVEFDDPKYRAPQLPKGATGTESKSTADHHATNPARLFDDPKYASGFFQMSGKAKGGEAKSGEAKSGSMDSLPKHDHLQTVHVRLRSNSLFDDPKYAPPESAVLLKQTLL